MTILPHGYRLSYRVTVEGSCRGFYDRLRTAGLIYDPHERRWMREELSLEQASSLVGRMRAAGLTASFERDGMILPPGRPKNPVANTSKRVKSARRRIARSIAEKAADPKPARKGKRPSP